VQAVNLDRLGWEMHVEICLPQLTCNNSEFAQPPPKNFYDLRSRENTSGNAACAKAFLWQLGRAPTCDENRMRI
jgi:hypothetical protein